jgi:hypothetical protein
LGPLPAPAPNDAAKTVAAGCSDRRANRRPERPRHYYG